MAGDWLKVTLDLPEKPEIERISRLTKLDHDAVVGKLIRVWSWFNKHSVDGCAEVGLQYVDRVVAHQGFAKAMMDAKWLTWCKGSPDRGLEIPNFDRHNSKGAKARALAMSRMQRLRYDEIVTESSPEKRREEKRESTPLASSDLSLSADENGKAVEYIPIVGGKQWPVSRQFKEVLEAAYPQVDVPLTLTQIRAWCVANPRQCKTERGVTRFINRWCEKEQNRG